MENWWRYTQDVYHRLSNEVVSSLSTIAGNEVVNYQDYVNSEDLDSKFNGAKTLIHIYTPQKYNWDCGIACCSMVFKYLARNDLLSSIYQHPHVSVNQGRPLWTIDMFDILRQVDDCHVVTMWSTFTSCQEYSLIPWYKDLYSSDIEHVNQQFMKAEAEKWLICHELFPISRLKSSLDKSISTPHVRTIAIMLVNSLLLTDISIDDAENSYVGHYILVVDYIMESDEFVYFNPSSSPEPLAISSSLLHAAWSHNGTDHDIILVERKSSES